MTTQC